MLTFAAILLIFMGILLIPMPIPIGIFVLAAGFVLLISVNKKAQRTIKYLRTKYPKFDATLQTVSNKSPHRFKVALAKTKPFKRRATSPLRDKC